MLDIYLTMEEILHPNIKNINLEQVFRALGDPVRFAAVKELLEADGEEKACGSFNYTVTKATFSHHIQILRDAGIFWTRVEGTRKFTSLRSKELNKKFPGLLELIRASK